MQHSHEELAFVTGSRTRALCVARSDPGNSDWPMWGGTPDRNMVSTMKGLPTTWDVKTKKNVKWVAELGSQAYGNPVVADGMVLRRHQQRRRCAIPKSRATRAC